MDSILFFLLLHVFRLNLQSIAVKSYLLRKQNLSCFIEIKTSKLKHFRINDNYSHVATSVQVNMFGSSAYNKSHFLFTAWTVCNWTQ